MSENVGRGAAIQAPGPGPGPGPGGPGPGPGPARLRQARAVPNPGQLRWAGPAKSFAASRSPKKVPRRKVCHWRRTLISVNRCVVAAQSCFLSARPRLWGQSMRPWPAMTKCVATAGEDAGRTPETLCQGGAVNVHESRRWTSTGITSNRTPPKTSSRSIKNQSCDYPEQGRFPHLRLRGQGRPLRRSRCEMATLGKFFWQQGHRQLSGIGPLSRIEDIGSQNQVIAPISSFAVKVCRVGKVT